MSGRMSSLLLAMNAGVMIGVVWISEWPPERPLATIGMLFMAAVSLLLAYWIMPPEDSGDTD